MPATSETPASPIETLFPGYFALVMATGIVAVAAAQQNIGWLADALYAIAATGYAVLSVLLVLRVAIFPRAFIADLVTHTRGFAFLTTVAATNVLASASVVVHGWWSLAWVLWWISLALWAFLLYATLISTVVRGNKPALGAGINGTWFLLTVSTQSIVVVGGLVFDRHASDALAFTLLAAFLVGIVLYLIVMTMVFLRWTFHALEPTEADPPAWIAGGAVAITVLAGSNLLLAAPGSERLTRLAGFIEGMTVLAWATATFWFPLMIAIGVWRHLIRRVPLRYHPSFWSLVFPIGMYSAATFRMRDAIDLDALEALPKIALAGALIAWSATAFGLAHRWVTTGLERVRHPHRYRDVTTTTHQGRTPMSEPTIPAGFLEARRTPLFDVATLPESLAESHRTTVWAQLFVQSGSVRYTDLDGDTPRDIGLGPGETAVIEPGVDHRVEPSTDATFFIQFYRAPDAPLVPGSAPVDSRRRSGPWEHRGCDLDTTEQIFEMVTRQYVDVVQDELLEPYFNFDSEFIDWQAHIESVSDYWSHVLLYAPGYDIDVIETHRPLHDTDPFTPELFDRWLEVFHDTVDGGWSGPNAERAKKRATGMAWAMAQRLLGKGTWQPAQHR